MDQKSTANNFSFGRCFRKAFFSKGINRVNPCMKLVKDVFLLSESKNNNLVFSPLSIDIALGRLVSGASGKTLKQVLKFLNCESPDTLRSRHSKLMKSRPEEPPTGTKPSFSVGVCISSALKPSLHADYLESLEFKDLVSKDTVSMLQSRLYCLGCWQYPNQFIPSLTEMSKFNLLGGKESVTIPFMSSWRDQYISCYNSFKVLRLPYKRENIDDRQFSMFIVLPKQRDGLSEVIEKVSSDPAAFMAEYIGAFHPLVPVSEFKIPKFKICFEFEAERVLKKVGLVLPLDESKAELTEMWNTSSKLYGASNKLYVDKVYHKCCAEIDEDGTVRAAYRDVISEESGIGSLTPRPPPVDFVADHPFMFIIREKRSGVVWFMGQVLNPSLSN